MQTHNFIFRAANLIDHPSTLTLILLTWRIWGASNNASRWQMGFNSAFTGLNIVHQIRSVYFFKLQRGMLKTLSAEKKR
jgi:hypothetical protein